MGPLMVNISIIIIYAIVTTGDKRLTDICIIYINFKKIAIHFSEYVTDILKGKENIKKKDREISR